MRPIAGWQHLMSSVVTLATRTGVDRYGKPTYGAPVTYRAHLGRRNRLVRNIEGQEVISGLTVHINGAPAVQNGDQLTLSTADIGSTESWAIQPTIVAITRAFDELGAHHTTLYMTLKGQ